MKTLDVKQRSEAWAEARKGLPTASRFDQILTASKGEPAAAQQTLINELLAESILPPQQGLVKSFLSPEMEQGMILEAEARCRFELEFAVEPVTEVGFVIHESGLFGGSPDALVGESSGAEIKCPGAAKHIGYLRAGKLPLAYKCQVHGYMLITGRPRWWFFSYARDLPPFCLEVPRDDFTDKLEAELYNFCAVYNEARKQFGLTPT